MLDIKAAEVSSDLILVMRHLRRLHEAERRTLGHLFSDPANCAIRKGLRDGSIRQLGDALGKIAIGAKAAWIKGRWESYISCRWTLDKELSLLSEDVAPSEQLLHAMTRFNLGESLGSRMIEKILRDGITKK